MALIINGERVEDDAIGSAKAQLAQQASGGGQPEWEARGMDLDTFAKVMMIAQMLVRQEAKRNGPDIPKKEIERAFNDLKKQHGGDEAFRKYLQEAERTEAQVREDVELSMKVDKLLDGVCGELVTPTDEELQAHYEAHTDDFEIPEQVHAAHIVKHAQGTILDVQAAHNDMKPILKRLKEGGNFEMLASRYSDCPENAGDLGHFARGAMVPEFEKVVFGLKEGEISDIFQTPFGLHIAKLYSRMPAKPRPFEDVKEQVRHVLSSERENAAIDAFTDTLRAKATIEDGE
jgi:peptidyl-prolyl cis-trans isomerase C